MLIPWSRRVSLIPIHRAFVLRNHRLDWVHRVHWQWTGSFLNIHPKILEPWKHSIAKMCKNVFAHFRPNTEYWSIFAEVMCLLLTGTVALLMTIPHGPFRENGGWTSGVRGSLKIETNPHYLKIWSRNGESIGKIYDPPDSTISTTKSVNTCLVPSSDSWRIQAKKMESCTSFCSKRACAASCSGVSFSTWTSEMHFVVIYLGMRWVIQETL